MTYSQEESKKSVKEGEVSSFAVLKRVSDRGLSCKANRVVTFRSFDIYLH